ncbi:PAS domain-containing protein, partial [Blautia pseudococcoides]|nr:PAS domain-containing protein [Blautia pseudococcoides]
MVTKDGKVLWILDKSQLYTDESGMDYISCMLIDITTEKKEQEKLRLALERHRIILDQSNDVIFELDMASNKLYYSRNWVKKFGYDPITDEINLRIPQSSHILPEDVQVFVHLLNRVSE